MGEGFSVHIRSLKPKPYTTVCLFPLKMEVGTVRRAFIAFVATLVFGTLAVAADSTNVVVPDNFFQAYPEPNGNVQFAYIMPSVNEPKQVGNLGWWNATAKFVWLQYNDKDFLAAWKAARHDPELQTTDKTSYDKYAQGSPEEKAEARRLLQELANKVAEKHQLQFLLESIPVDAQNIADKSAELRSAPPPTKPLISYCPGQANNVTINSNHPDFAQFQRMVGNPTTSKQYDAAIAEFSNYLTSNPTASIVDRNAELSKLVEPILSKVR